MPGVPGVPEVLVAVEAVEAGKDQASVAVVVANYSDAVDIEAPTSTDRVPVSS